MSVRREVLHAVEPVRRVGDGDEVVGVQRQRERLEQLARTRPCRDDAPHLRAGGVEDVDAVTAAIEHDVLAVAGDGKRGVVIELRDDVRRGRSDRLQHVGRRTGNPRGREGKRQQGARREDFGIRYHRAMRLTFAQLNLTVGAFDANFERIRAAVARAEAESSELVVFSELATTGYPPRDLLTHPAFVDRNLDTLERVARLSTGRLGILIGFVDRNPSSEGKPLFNAVALCRSGRVVERRYKSLLPTYDVFDEDRYFEPARDGLADAVRRRPARRDDLRGRLERQGGLARNLYHRDPVRELAAAGAELLINISASPFTLEKADVRRRLVTQEAVEHGRYFFYLNQVGGNDELVFDGHSIGIAPDGTRGAARRRVRGGPAHDRRAGGPRLPGRRASRRRSSATCRRVRRGGGLSRARARPARLHAQVRLLERRHRVVGRRRLGASPRASPPRRSGPGNVLGVAMPTAVLVGAQRRGRRGARARARHRLRGHSDRRRVPVVPRRARARARRRPARRDRGEPAGARARRRAHGALEPARVAAALDRQQVRAGRRATARSTATCAAAWRVISDVPKMLVYRLARYINRDGTIIPRVDAHQAAERRAAPGPEGHRLAAAVRGARSDHRGLRRTATSTPSAIVALAASTAPSSPTSSAGSTAASTSAARRRPASRFRRRRSASDGDIRSRPTIGSDLGGSRLALGLGRVRPTARRLFCETSSELELSRRCEVIVPTAASDPERYEIPLRRVSSRLWSWMM